MNRHIVNMRPLGDASATVYSPHRDLGNLYPSAMREAVRSLDTDCQPEYLKTFLEGAGVSQEVLGDAVAKMVDAHALFIGDRTITEPADAFARTGFSECRWEARMAIFERLGEVMMGGFFVALRDVTREGDLPPQARDIAEMIGAGRALMLRLGGGTYPVAAISDSAETFEKYHAFWQDGERVLANLREEIFKTNNKAVIATRDMRRLQALSWWRRLRVAIRYLFTGKLL